MRLSGKIFVMTLAALQTAGAVEPQPQASAPVSLVHRAPAQVGELRVESIEIEGMTVETQVLVFKVASAIDTRKSPFES